MVEKIMKKTEKTRKLRPKHDNSEKVQEMQYKNAQKRLRQALFPPEVDFSSILGCPLGPRGPPGMTREPARSFPMFLRFFALSKNRARPGLGGPGEVPGHPQGPPRNHFGRILSRFLKSIFRRTAMATLSFLWTLSSNLFTFVALIDR